MTDETLMVVVDLFPQKNCRGASPKHGDGVSGQKDQSIRFFRREQRRYGVRLLAAY